MIWNFSSQFAIYNTISVIKWLSLRVERGILIIGLGSNASKYSEMFRFAQKDNDVSNSKSPSSYTLKHPPISR